MDKEAFLKGVHAFEDRIDWKKIDDVLLATGLDDMLYAPFAITKAESSLVTMIASHGVFMDELDAAISKPAKALADMLQPIVLKAITDAWDDVSLAHVILALNMLKERYTLIHASRSACHSPGRLSPASQFFYYSEPLNRK